MKEEILNIFKVIGKSISVVWNAVSEKGKFTTLWGIYMIVRATYTPLLKHIQGVTFEEAYMWQIIWFLIGGITLIILPSEISISRTDGFKIKD